MFDEIISIFCMLKDVGSVNWHKEL
jgi:hypothetical protein